MSATSKSRPPDPGRRGPRPEINVTPLVDVVLVLLIIFMVIAPQLEAGERVELPGISHIDEKAKLESTVLTLTLSGRYILEKEVVAPEKVLSALRDSHQQFPRRRLVLKADRAVEYGKMRELFAKAQEIGFPGVALMVDEHARSRTGAP
jgi:biopolymer transport protein TolR